MAGPLVMELSSEPHGGTPSERGMVDFLENPMKKMDDDLGVA